MLPLKYFLIGQFVKFFLLIGLSNASKHLQQNFDHSLSSDKKRPNLNDMHAKTTIRVG